jgi:uncharacterized protein
MMGTQNMKKILVLIMIVSTSVYGAELFVSPDGGDSNAGTQEMSSQALPEARPEAGDLKHDAGETYIDIHFHADARPEGGGDLPRVAQWMKTNRVDRLIVMQYRRTLPRDENEARRIVKNFQEYQGKIYRFCVLLPSDIPSKEAAVKALRKMKAEGAIGVGEHYGRKLYFDDPTCMHLYAACAEVGLPILFHMDGGNNKDDAELSHLENALKSHPACLFIGHGPGFWSKMKVVDGLLAKHTNLYADISAGSGARAIGRDKEYSRAFLTRHADRALFGTDGGPWSFGEKPPPQFKLVEELELMADVKAKLCRDNAISLFTLDRN